MSTGLKMSADPDLLSRMNQFQARALILGCAALAASAVAWFLWPAHFLAPYLVGYLYWLGLALGCIGFTMLHHLVGGQWGLVIRRPLEAGALTVIPLAVLFLPIALGVHALYPWAGSGSPGTETKSVHSAYLNVPFFLLRAGLYFAIWIVMAALQSWLSRRQDSADDDRPTRRLRRQSAPGTIALFLTGTFSAIDWVMSLEPAWASTIFGAMLITGDAMATLALMIVVSAQLASARPISQIATPGRLNDLGNLLLAFVMLWAYMSFCQFLIIWSGNLAEEIPWYLRRTRGGWQWLALALIVFQFFLPFFVLLFREAKRDPGYLVRVTLWILAMRWVNLVWLVIPASAEPAHPRIPWVEVAVSVVATIGVGGVWTAFFIGRLKRGPLVPLRDPSSKGALEHAGA
jgi:hypothetical protein